LLFELFIHLPSQSVQKQNFNRSTQTHRELLDFQRAQAATPLLPVVQLVAYPPSTLSARRGKPHLTENLPQIPTSKFLHTFGRLLDAVSYPDG